MLYVPFLMVFGAGVCFLIQICIWNVFGFVFGVDTVLIPSKITHSKTCQIFNNYSPKWRWLVVDIYRAAKRRGKYPPLATDTEVNRF